jgi:histidinol-phosphate aminotransferase
MQCLQYLFEMARVALTCFASFVCFQRVRDALVLERERLLGMLQQISFLEPYPSSANFILCRVVGQSAKEVQEQLAAQGIMVRHYTKKELSGYIRISVGLPEHTDAVMNALLKCKSSSSGPELSCTSS